MIRIEKIFDAITGEETIIEREETSEEKSEREAQEVYDADQKLKTQERENKRLILLQKLGITEEEAKLLLS